MSLQSIFYQKKQLKSNFYCFVLHGWHMDAHRKIESTQLSPWLSFQKILAHGLGWT
jgi:hypothetical protein